MATILLPITCFLLLVVIVIKYYTKGGLKIYKSFDLNNINIDEKLYKDILIYYVKYVTSNTVKPLYLIINNANGYIEERKENIYLGLIPTDKSKD